MGKLTPAGIQTVPLVMEAEAPLGAVHGVARTPAQIQRAVSEEASVPVATVAVALI